jgi:hypothetical protein
VIGWQSLSDGFAECGNGVDEGFEAVVGGHAGEMKGVALCVDVAFEGCGVVAAEGKRCGSKLEARGGLLCWRRSATTLPGLRRVDGGGQQDVAVDEGI